MDWITCLMTSIPTVPTRSSWWCHRRPRALSCSNRRPRVRPDCSRASSARLVDRRVGGERMKRIFWLGLLVGLVVLARLATARQVTFGSREFDADTLARLTAEPADAVVFGMATFSPGVSPQQAAAGVRRLRVFGLLQVDQAMRDALADRITVSGTIVVRDQA